jgi:hypothetical protein
MVIPSAFGANSCEIINLNRSYKVIGGCEISDKYLKSRPSIQLMRIGDDQDCSFSVKATVEERTIEYSIPRPSGVMVGAHDMCALWAFDEISRPGSFPKDMIEVCKVWQNRPPDREVVKVFNI